MIGGILKLDNVEYWANMMIQYLPWFGVLISVRPLPFLTTIE
jgi:hypothetical protein